MITRKDNKFLQQRNGKDNKFSGENLILMERCSRIALFFKKVRPTQVKRRTTQHEQSVDVPSTKLSTVSYRFCPVVGMPFGRRNPQLQRSWVFIYAVGRQKKIWGLEGFTPFIGIFEFIRGKNGNFLVRPRGREGEARNAKMKKNLQPILSINDHNMILMIPCHTIACRHKSGD
jgi:hypothetical protein